MVSLVSDDEVDATRQCVPAPIALQPKLLQVIETGEFERLGSSETIKSDVRIVAATNRNLEAEVRKGAFREDLWYPHHNPNHTR